MSNDHKLCYLQQHMFILTVSVDQDSGHGVAGSSDCNPGIWPGLASHLEVLVAVDLLPGSGGHWQDSLPHGYKAKGSSFVLVIGWRPCSAS